METVTLVGLILDDENAKERVNIVSALEAGRRVARDVGFPDPERMAPAKIAEYLEETFKGNEKFGIA